jgi:plasmid stabilization system protein ParE
MNIEWSPNARRQYLERLSWLRIRDSKLAVRLAADVDKAVRTAAQFPLANRSARRDPTSPERMKSLPKWHKIILYQIEADRIVILTIRDTRQEQKP